MTPQRDFASRVVLSPCRRRLIIESRESTGQMVDVMEELSERIDCFVLKIPLLRLLTNHDLVATHWASINAAIGTDIELDADST